MAVPKIVTHIHFVILWIFALANAAHGISIGFSIENQYLPVAYANKDYEARLASDTFINSNGASNYSVSGLPDWLTFDTNALSFSGTAPSDNSDSTISFTVTATDSSGSVNAQGEILVKAASAVEPEVASDKVLTNALASAGSLSNGTSVVVRPGDEFKIQFPGDIFVQTTSPVSYIGLSGDHSPLPDWIRFDASTLTFSGQGPIVNSKIAPAQAFPMSLILSQDAGFANSEVLFAIEVGAHQFTTNVTVDTVQLTSNNTAVEPGEFKIPLDMMELDGQTLQRNQVAKITANLTDYMQLDQETMTLLIAPTPSDKSAIVTFTVYDPFDDFVQFSLAVNVPAIKSSATSTTMATTTSASHSHSATARITSVSSTSSSQPTAAAAVAINKKPDNKKTTAIACGVTIPVVAAIAAFVLFFCCWRRRKQEKELFGTEPHSSPQSSHSQETMVEGKTGRTNSMNTMSYPLVPGKVEWPASQKIYTPTSFYSTDRTPIGTPLPPNSPQRASTLNFMRLDDYDENSSTYGGNTNSTLGSNSSRNSQQQHQAAIAAVETAVNHPRNSWRHPQPTDRWQDHQPLGSMASIPANEFVTLKRVDTHQTRHSINNAPRTHSIKASDDSGNVKSVGTHSTTSSYYDDEGSISMTYASERSEIDRRRYPTHGQAF